LYCRKKSDQARLERGAQREVRGKHGEMEKKTSRLQRERTVSSKPSWDVISGGVDQKPNRGLGSERGPHLTVKTTLERARSVARPRSLSTKKKEEEKGKGGSRESRGEKRRGGEK